MGEPDRDSWHLDKRVPIALIVSFVLQTILLVAIGATWKAETDARLTALEKTDIDRKSLAERLTVIEVQQRYIAEQMVEIKAALKERRP